MQLKDVFYGIADFFEWAFGLLPFLGNIPNIILFIIGFVCFFYWMGQMVKYKRAGES